MGQRPIGAKGRGNLSANRGQSRAQVASASPPLIRRAGGIAVTVRNGRGEVVVQHEGRTFRGQLPRVPARLHIGQQLRLKILLPTGEGKTKSADVLGKVLHVFDRSQGHGRVGLRSGTGFDFGIMEYSGEALPLPVIGAYGVESLLAKATGSTDLRDLPRPPAEAEATAGLRGDLQTMGLADVLQTLEQGRRTAHIEVSASANAPAEGEVVLRHGKVATAYSKELKGKEAFFDLMQRQTGTFRVRFCDSVEGDDIDRSVGSLVFELGGLLEQELRQSEKPLGQSDEFDLVDADFLEADVVEVAAKPQEAEVKEAEVKEAEAVAPPVPEASAPTKSGVFAGFFSELEQQQPPPKAKKTLNVEPQSEGEDSDGFYGEEEGAGFFPVSAESAPPA